MRIPKDLLSRAVDSIQRLRALGPRAVRAEEWMAAAAAAMVLLGLTAALSLSVGRNPGSLGESSWLTLPRDMFARYIRDDPARDRLSPKRDRLPLDRQAVAPDSPPVVLPGMEGAAVGPDTLGPDADLASIEERIRGAISGDAAEQQSGGGAVSAKSSPSSGGDAAREGAGPAAQSLPERAAGMEGRGPGSTTATLKAPPTQGPRKELSFRQKLVPGDDASEAKRASPLSRLAATGSQSAWANAGPRSATGFETKANAGGGGGSGGSAGAGQTAVGLDGGAAGEGGEGPAGSADATAGGEGAGEGKEEAREMGCFKEGATRCSAYKCAAKKQKKVSKKLNSIASSCTPRSCNKGATRDAIQDLTHGDAWNSSVGVFADEVPSPISKKSDKAARLLDSADNHLASGDKEAASRDLSEAAGMMEETEDSWDKQLDKTCH